MVAIRLSFSPSSLTAMLLVFLTTASTAAEVQLGRHLFSLPDGYEIEEVAGPPLVLRPICADFDEFGRLYVADSSGSNDPVKQQLEEKPHRILCLEDTNGDHKFDTSTVFAERMMFPEGVLWHQGSLYVAAPPSIWKLTDTDGDGIADQREEWFDGKTLTGCANDLHGPYLGPDGWIYWCKGAFASQTYEIPQRATLETRAAHVFRRHPTKGWIEPVMTGGMDNPVELSFSRAGEPFFTTTFLQHPGGGRRDGIIHAIYGGVYGKVHDVLDGHPRTGDIMPVLVHLGPAAPCGLARLESTGLGDDYQDNLLACSFNMHKVTRHVLQGEGASFVTDDQDFLVSENVDFHPTDVLEDADGSVLVVDTGGWYKICCPTSHLYKPDVLGAIYRIRRSGANIAENPRGESLNWAVSAAELAPRLEDERWAVRQRAIGALALQGPRAIPSIRQVLQDSDNRLARNCAVWALTRIDHPQARAALRMALRDNADIVRQAAMHGLALWQDAESVEPLCAILQHGTMADQRVAAEALGRIGDAGAVRFLLAAAAQDHDRALEHSLIYALYEIGDAGALAAALSAPTTLPPARRAALIALDQLHWPGLEAKMVAAQLQSPEPSLRETAVWIADHHPEWAGELADYLRAQLFARELNAAAAEELERQLPRYASHQAVQKLCEDVLNAADLDPTRKALTLRAMRSYVAQEIPGGWTRALEAILRSSDVSLIVDAVVTLRSWHDRGANLPQLREALLLVAARPDIDIDTRLEALAALPATGELEDSYVRFVIQQLHSEQPIERRLRAADVLASSVVKPGELPLVIAQIEQLGPMELGRLLPMFAENTDHDVGMQLLAALRANPSITGVPVAILKANLSKFGAAVQSEAQQLYAELDAEAASQQAVFEQLLATLEEGDVRRGQAVFYGRKAACSSCHAIGYLGGDIGPDLTRIAQIRTPRDLLESIVFPSASFVRSYEPVSVVTSDGQVHNGVLRKNAAEQIVLATGADKFVTLRREEIEEIVPSKVSVMPAGLDKQLTRQELADLMAFLKASK